jgi:hypothetical protein
VSDELTSGDIEILNAARTILSDRASYGYDAKAPDVRIAVMAEVAEHALFRYLNNYNAYGDADDLTDDQLFNRLEEVPS